jgi:hypothetical protein
MDKPEISVKSARTRLLLIVAMVGLPMLSAWFLYRQAPELITVERTNQGELIMPPLDFGMLASNGRDVLAGRWGLLMAGTGHCDKICIQMLYECRQVHAALGKDIDRVQRFYLLADGEPDPAFAEILSGEYPHLKIISLDTRRLEDTFGPAWANDYKVYIVDPLGNIMMVYTMDKLGKPMLKDLKHLLKASRIG